MMTRRKTRSSLRSRDEGEAFERIPFDLVIEIILRLPVKSVGRFRCVSKQWNSTFRGSYFIDTFFTRSSFPPKILFTCLKDGETFFFSSPQPQDTLSPIAADIHMSFPVNCPTNIYRPVRGLLCGLNQRTSKGKTVTMPLLCNPSTGESFALPRVRTRKKGVMSYFGYDPIDKDFKVLCMTRSHVPPYVSEKHQVLTVGTEKKWRMIECDILHDPVAVEDTNIFSLYDGICINGVVYYLAILQLEGVGDGFPDIVSFDIKSEKFSYIKKAYGEGMMLNSGADLESTLVNYKGKLAKLQPNTVDDLYTEIYNGIQLWVLENAEKHEWSSYIYVLPPPWKNIFEETTLCFVATTSKGEIVLSPNTISDSFYLIYYNPEKDTITKVGIQGMEAFKGYKAYTFLDHVEDVTLVSKGFGSWARLVT